SRRDPLAVVAVIVALIALVFSMTGGAPAKNERSAGTAGVSRKLAKLGARLEKLKLSCPIPDAVDLGTWCLESGLHPVPPRDIGENNYVYAAKTCVREGGWLPSAAQLIGAASRAKLQSTIDDNSTTSGRDEFQ